MSKLLQVTDLAISYGGVHALDGVSMEVESGEILGLIGPNGAGKTTLFECIAGFTKPDAGTVVFDGVDVTRWKPERRAMAGLIRSFQDAKLFGTLSVFQTILVSLEKHTPSHLLPSALAAPWTAKAELAKGERADELIESMGLTAFRDKWVNELSTGTRRVVELACVIALEPRLLLLDEPSSGIAQREVEALGEVLLRVKRVTGCTMLIIEHDMPLVMGLADRIVAMESGRPIADGTPDDIRHDPAVISSYLGTTDVVIERSGTGAASARKAPAKRARPAKAAPAKKKPLAKKPAAKRTPAKKTAAKTQAAKKKTAVKKKTAATKRRAT